jgi:glyoxylase-like metal-dependent hydrolase (beta-lactamase superfamily II)
MDGPIYQANIALSDVIPLNVYLVKGSNHAVWIDSGVKSMFPVLEETMAHAGVSNSDLRFILHTHSHHDHMGCNAQLKKKTGCLIAAHPHYAAWHENFEQHYQAFARSFPHLIADTPELREEVLSILDEPCPLDLYLEEGVEFHLGGGVSLKAISFPGHLLAEFGWFEGSSKTLILGDAITGLDWPLFHSHLSVKEYRRTLQKLRNVIPELNVEHILFAHFPPMNPQETMELILEAETYIDDIETTMLRILAGQDNVSLEELWAQTCSRMKRLQDFRALNTVYAHVQDLLERDIIREILEEVYALQ